MAWKRSKLKIIVPAYSVEDKEDEKQNDTESRLTLRYLLFSFKYNAEGDFSDLIEGKITENGASLGSAYLFEGLSIVRELKAKKKAVPC